MNELFIGFKFDSIAPFVFIGVMIIVAINGYIALKIEKFIL